MSAAGEQVTTFIVDGMASLTLVIPDKGETPADTKTFQAARRVERKVVFRPMAGQVRRGSAAVADPKVAAAVRVLCKRPREKYKIYQDLKALAIRCPYCDFTLSSNTEADQLRLAEHLSSCEGFAEAQDEADAKDAKDAKDAQA